MSNDTRRVYGEQLQLRRSGVPSDISPDASFDVVKPHFYADTHQLVDDVRGVFSEFTQKAAPYGLYERDDEPFSGFRDDASNRWESLERVLSTTARLAFEAASPSVTECPYHKSLSGLGRVALNPAAPMSEDIESLREVVFSAANFAPAIIVNLLKRMSVLASVNSAQSELETLARNSSQTLLREPLHHAQQRARAFMFTLASGFEGTIAAIDRNEFLPADLIRQYTTLDSARGQEAIAWSMPTEEFTLRAPVQVVANRLMNPEGGSEDQTVTEYPVGTRLGDISVDESTIGCPGRKLAYDMWERTVDVIVGENMWEQPAATNRPRKSLNKV